MAVTAAPIAARAAEVPAPAGAARTAAATGLPAVAVAARPPEAAVTLGERDQRRRQALGRFQFDAMVTVDQCLNARPEARGPNNLILSFERAQPTDDQFEHFRVAKLEPAGIAAGRAAPMETPSWKCLDALRGRALDIPVGLAPQEPTFREVVSLSLPTSLGWAGPPPSP